MLGHQALKTLTLMILFVLAVLTGMLLPASWVVGR